MIIHEVNTEETTEIKALRKEIFGTSKMPTQIQEKTIRYFLVLRLEKTPLGFIEMAKIDPETYEVTTIGVREPYRHQKVGTYLIKYGQVKLKTVGGRKMRAIIPQELLPFFRQNNFRLADDEAIEIGGSYYILGERKLY